MSESAKQARTPGRAHADQDDLAGLGAAPPARDHAPAMVGAGYLLGEKVFRSATGGEPAADPGASFARATSGGGGEVPYRGELERAFGHDLSSVSAHTGRAEELGELKARGAAQGERVAFAAANPSKEEVAHEVAHVVQHRRAGGATGGGVSSPGDAAEREADTAARQVASGGPARVAAAPRASVSLARGLLPGAKVKVKVRGVSGVEDSDYDATILEVLSGGDQYRVQFSEPIIEATCAKKDFDEKFVYQPKTTIGYDKPTVSGEKVKPDGDLSKLMTERFGSGVRKTSTRPEGQRKELQVKWGSCGFTAENLIGELKKLGAVFEEQLLEFAGQAQAEAIERELNQEVQVPTLLDCTIEDVHEFTLEAHPDGRRHLAQGYKGFFLPWWWQGLGPERPGEGAPKDRELNDMRERYGMGQDIQGLMPELSGNLGALVGADQWNNPKATKTWKQLPFSPNDQMPLESKAKQEQQTKIKIIVIKRKLVNAEVVYEKLRGVERRDFLCDLVLKGAKDEVEKTFGDKSSTGGREAQVAPSRFAGLAENIMGYLPHNGVLAPQDVLREIIRSRRYEDAPDFWTAYDRFRADNPHYRYQLSPVQVINRLDRASPTRLYIMSPPDWGRYQVFRDAHHEFVYP